MLIMNESRTPGTPLALTVSLVDQQFARTKTLGILNVSLGLCRALARSPKVGRLTLLTNASLPRIGQPDSGRVVLAEYAAPERFRRVWWDQIGVYRASRRAGNEWLLLPKGYPPFLRRCPVKLATYVHDVMPEYYREHYPRGFPRFENYYFRAALRAAIARSRVILVNTECTAREIQRVAERHGLNTPPIKVAGIGFERPPETPPQPRTRIIVLASQWPHKRTDLALQYVARWQEQRRFAGSIDWVGRLPAELAFPGIANWHLHSRLAPDEWNRLLGEAQALIYFSDYEGFGMPPVEAVLAGVCPVFSDLPVTREVMQGAGCCFANDRYEALAAALDEALRTPEQRVRQWADQLLARHQWAAVAERAIQALNSSGS